MIISNPIIGLNARRANYILNQKYRMKKMTKFITLMLILTATVATAEPWYRDYFSMVTMPHEKTDAALEAAGADAFRASRIWGGWYGYWFTDRIGMASGLPAICSLAVV